MASNPNSFLSRLFPTNHRLILNSTLRKELKNISGEVLICGAGHNPYKGFGSVDSVITLDLDEGLDGDCVADIHELPFPKAKFDSLVAIEVLEHCNNPDKGLRECIRVLRPGGTLVLSTPFMYHIHADPFDFFRFSRSYFINRLEKFGSVKLVAFGNLLHIFLDSLSSSYAIFKFIRPMSFLASRILPISESEKFPSGYVVVFQKSLEQ